MHEMPQLEPHRMGMHCARGYLWNLWRQRALDKGLHEQGQEALRIL